MTPGSSGDVGGAGPPPAAGTADRPDAAPEREETRRPGARRRRLAARALGLAIVPLCTALMAQGLQRASGPDWLAYNNDPEYHYLVNALLVADGERAAHTHHPGVPLHLIGGAAVRAAFALRGEGTMPLHVLGHPEQYLRVLHGTLVALQAGVAFAAGAWILVAGGGWAAALAIQATAILSLSSVAALHRVSPEPVLLMVCILFAGALVASAVREAEGRETKAAAWLGLLCAVGLGTKITFAPLVLIPLVTLPSMRARLVFAAVTVGGFATMLWNPFIDPRTFFDLQSSMAASGGAYGTGEAGGRGLAELWFNARAWGREIVRVEPAGAAIFALSVGVLVPSVLAAPTPDAAPASRRRARLLAGILLAQTAQVLLAVTNTVVLTRYLLPALGLLGVNVAVCFSFAGDRPDARVRRAGLGLCVVSMLVVAWMQGTRIRTYRFRVASRARESLAMGPRVAREFPAHRVAYYFRASSVPLGLWIGNRLSADPYVPELSELYPDALFYDVWTNTFTTFAGPVPPGDVLGGRAPLLVQGTPVSALGPDLDLDEVVHGRVERVYRVRAARGEPPAS